MDNGEVHNATSIASGKPIFRISTGHKDFLEDDKEHELQSPLTKDGNSYAKICSSNKNFGVDATLVTEMILKSLSKQLLQVDLLDFNAGRPDVFEVTRIFSSALENCDITYLNLSNNAMNEKGVRVCKTLFKSLNNLEEL